MQETTTGITFTIRDTLKTTRPGKHLGPIEIRSFAPDSRLSPVTYIKHYITKTHSLRGNPRLLISYTKPHKPVSTFTVARWIRSTLQDAGIDVSIFSAHNSRTVLLNALLRFLFTTTYPIYIWYVTGSCWSSQALNSHGTP